jgi:hypothetical protein
LEQVSSFERLAIDPEVENVGVTIDIDASTVRQALVAILKASQVNYAVSADDGGRSIRLAAGNRAVMAARTPGAPSSPFAGAQPIFESVAAPAAQVEPAQPDSASDSERLLLLQQALNPPAMKAPPGTLIELPFPGTDGQPLTAVVPPQGTPVALPFPSIGPDANPAAKPPSGRAAKPPATGTSDRPGQPTSEPTGAPPDRQ